MSIDPGEVVDTVVALLQGVHGATDVAPPPGNPDVYGIVDAGAGDRHSDGGDQADTARHLTLRIRLRIVVRHADQASAKRMATDLAHRYEVALLARTNALELVGDDGTGWRVSDRGGPSSSGPIAEGGLVNIVDDYSLWVVPVP